VGAFHPLYLAKHGKVQRQHIRPSRTLLQCISITQATVTGMIYVSSLIYKVLRRSMQKAVKLKKYGGVAMLSQRVTKDSILRELEKLSPDGLQEVAQFIEFVQFQAQQPLKKPKASRKHSAFGLWAKYPEAQDPAVFAQTLRQKIEKRQDV